MATDGSIVVGVDESAGAAEALRWAHREGALRGWPVTAVLCWGYLDQHHGTPEQTFVPEYTVSNAGAALHAIVARVLGEGAATVERRTVNDLAPRGLLEASADASLLVLGARGLGSFRELLLGSVSSRCLHEAKIPVAIVRSDATGPRFGPVRVVVGVDGSETSQRALDWALDEARVRGAWSKSSMRGRCRRSTFRPSPMHTSRSTTQRGRSSSGRCSGPTRPDCRCRCGPS
jgi:nucleotide-binding universal stress UspA family protein